MKCCEARARFEGDVGFWMICWDLIIQHSTSKIHHHSGGLPFCSGQECPLSVDCGRGGLEGGEHRQECLCHFLRGSRRRRRGSLRGWRRWRRVRSRFRGGGGCREACKWGCEAGRMPTVLWGRKFGRPGRSSLPRSAPLVFPIQNSPLASRNKPEAINELIKTVVRLALASLQLVLDIVFFLCQINHY